MRVHFNRLGRLFPKPPLEGAANSSSSRGNTERGKQTEGIGACVLAGTQSRLPSVPPTDPGQAVGRNTWPVCEEGDCRPVH